LAGSHKAAVPAVSKAAKTVKEMRIGFPPIDHLKLRETSFPRTFAKWLIGLEYSAPRHSSIRKIGCFSTI
jgi:hypothetical protein